MSEDTNANPVEKPEASSASPEKVIPENTVVHNVEGVLKKNRDLLSENKQIKEKIRQLEESKLIEKEEYKTLYQTEKDEKAQLVDQLNQQKAMIAKASKIGALKRDLSRSGINPDYMDHAVKLVDLSTLQLDEETQIVSGIDSAIQVLKEQLPPFFGSKSPNMNQSVPEGLGPKLTMEEWRKLPVEEQAKRSNEVLENMGIAFKK